MKSFSIMKIFLIFVLSAQLCAAKRKSSVIINYDSEVKICDDVDSRAMMETSHLRPTRINETTVKLEGTFQILKTIDNWKLAVQIARKTPLGSKEVLVTHELKDFCAEVAKRHQNTIYSVYLKAINFTDCPIKPGTYQVKNMQAETFNLPIQSMPEGVYYLTFTYYDMNNAVGGIFGKKGKRVGCLSFACVIESE